MPAAVPVQALRSRAATAVPREASSVCEMDSGGWTCRTSKEGKKKQFHLKRQISKDEFSSSCEGQVLQYSFVSVADGEVGAVRSGHSSLEAWPGQGCSSRPLGAMRWRVAAQMALALRR